ncbi:MAG: phage holin family protein [Psychroflexus sp.]
MKVNIGHHFSELSEDTKLYIQKLIEYYKLDAFKKLSKSLSTSMHLFIVGGIILLLLLFLSIGLAFLIGKELDSVSNGFFIVGGAYLVFLIISLLFGQKFIDKVVLGYMVRLMNSHDEIDIKSSLDEEEPNEKA